MTITGLENNYYFSGNDIWIKIFGFATVPLRVEIKPINNTTGVSLPPLKLYSPSDIFTCNISLVVRALQPDPNHLTVNTMCSFSFEVTAYFADTEITDTQTVLGKNFIRGGRNKQGLLEWFTVSGTNLLILNKWIKWQGVTLPSLPYRIEGNTLVAFNPTASETYPIQVMGMCSPTIIKFLNSMGGYQFYVFEHAEQKLKTKGKGSVSRIAYKLREDRSRSIGRTEEEILVLKTKTPEAIQDIFMDLIKSNDVLLYDPQGIDDLGRWQRLELDQANEAVHNTADRVYQNEVSFKIPNYVNRDL